MATIELSKSRQDVGSLVKARDDLAAAQAEGTTPEAVARSYNETLEQVLAGLTKEFGVPFECYWEASLSGGSNDNITFSTEAFREFMMKRG